MIFDIWTTSKKNYLNAISFYLACCLVISQQNHVITFCNLESRIKTWLVNILKKFPNLLIKLWADWCESNQHVNSFLAHCIYQALLLVVLSYEERVLSEWAHIDIPTHHTLTLSLVKTSSQGHNTWASARLIKSFVWELVCKYIGQSPLWKCVIDEINFTHLDMFMDEMEPDVNQMLICFAWEW